MTTLQELLEQWEARSKDALPTDAMLINKHIRELRAALAQQAEQQPVAWYEYNQDLDAWFLAYGHNPKAKTRPLVFGDTAAPAPQAQQMEPTDDQLVKGVKAMRLFVTKNSVADFKLGYMAALAAAPAPQPAQGVGRTNPGDETGGAVERFGWQTFLGKSPEIIPATNGSFVWYSDYLKLWQSAQPVHQGERAELIRRLLAIANTEANEVADALNEAADMLQSAQPVAQPLSDSEIEKLREKTFSTYNPYCPVDSKSMRKAVRAAEAAHGIGEVK